MSTVSSTKNSEKKCPIPGCLNWYIYSRSGICNNCYKISSNIGIFKNKNMATMPLIDIIYLYK